MIVLKQRPGLTPIELGESNLRNHCPDIWETDTGDFIVIGKEVTNQIDITNTDASIGPDERGVLIPRATMLSAVEGLKHKEVR